MLNVSSEDFKKLLPSSQRAVEVTAHYETIPEIWRNPNWTWRTQHRGADI